MNLMHRIINRVVHPLAFSAMTLLAAGGAVSALATPLLAALAFG